MRENAKKEENKLREVVKEVEKGVEVLKKDKETVAL